MVVNKPQIFMEASHELLRLGYGVRFRAGGQSMHPTIKDGEVITVEPALPDKIKRGDIVLYRFRQGVIAHRVVRIEKRAGDDRRFILRGDSSAMCDAPVEAEKILGRVVSVERGGRDVDLASRKAKLIRAARSRASRLKRTRLLAQRRPAVARLEERPEHELLLLCARTSLDGELRAKIRSLLEGGIDWQYLLQTAERHGLLPLLCSNLINACPDAVPPSQLSELETRFRKNTISNMLLASEMISLVKMFESHGVTAIPFKGPTLALAAYNDIALRQFHDIDLLLPREDVLKARALLVSRGYKPDRRLTRAQEEAYLKCDCEYNFKGSAYVELQWEIVPGNYSFAVNDEALRGRLGRIEIEGASLMSLSPEDLLLILSAHGTKHAWGRLAWVCDVAEMVRARADIDWSQLMERARRLGGERMLLLALFLANDLLGAALPETVLEKVRADGAVRRLGAQVRGRLFAGPVDSSQVIKHSLFFILARERRADRARCRIRMALAPTVNDLTFLRLPRALSFAYYLLRPVRLVGKHGLKLLTRSAG
jgi:hypothetical protein